MAERLYSRIFRAAALAIARRTPSVATVRRPASESTPEFDLAYVRTGPIGDAPPTIVIPGGPGLASILPYRSLRKLAARRGLDLIMVEHRGVGLSRTDRTGRELPASAMQISEVIADIAAVLDHEGIDRVHVVGSSYGSYLASSFGVTHPGRVAGMILDSALQSAEDLEIERAMIRRLLWDGPSEVATLIRQLDATGSMDQRVLLDVTRAAYELGGEDLLLPLLRRRIRNHRSLAWRALEAYAIRDESIARYPAIYEFDLVGTIAFRELGYGAIPDGLPLDPALTYAPLAPYFPKFAGEQLDLTAGASGFDWPLVLVTGSRDLRTPPEIAARVANAAPDAVTVPIENGHSALDTHPMALLNTLAWLVAGRHRDLPALATRLDRLPRRGLVARAAMILEKLL